MRTRLLAERIPLVREFSERVLPWFDGSGPVHPVIGAVFPFTGIAGAHAAMEEDTNFGKIVLTRGRVCRKGTRPGDSPGLGTVSGWWSGFPPTPIALQIRSDLAGALRERKLPVWAAPHE